MDLYAEPCSYQNTFNFALGSVVGPSHNLETTANLVFFKLWVVTHCRVVS